MRRLDAETTAEVTGLGGSAGGEQVGMEQSGPSTQTAGDPSLAELLRQVTDQTTELAHREVELAKAEMEIKARRIGTGLGAFGGAGLVALLAAGALTATFILALSTAVDAWLAGLIVTVAYSAVAAVMALVGRRKIESGTPPIPERAIETTRQDIETARQGVKEGIER